jgi:hypothetical protein
VLVSTAGPSTDSTPPRYEFRVWGDLDALSATVATRIDGVNGSEGEECYLLAPPDSGVNPKIRDGALDVKRLLRVRRDCEQWEPVEKASFPLTAATISASLFGVMGIESPVLERHAYSVDQLLPDVVAPDRRLDAVSVEKSRTIGTAGACRAEIARVTIAGTYSTTTIAIESSDLDALVTLRAELGLERSANENYPHAIRRIVGGTDPMGGREQAGR